MKWVIVRQTACFDNSASRYSTQCNSSRPIPVYSQVNEDLLNCMVNGRFHTIRSTARRESAVLRFEQTYRVVKRDVGRKQVMGI